MKLKQKFECDFIISKGDSFLYVTSSPLVDPFHTQVFSELNKELNAKLRKSENERKELQQIHSESAHKISSAEKLVKVSAVVGCGTISLCANN